MSDTLGIPLDIRIKLAKHARQTAYKSVIKDGWIEVLKAKLEHPEELEDGEMIELAEALNKVPKKGKAQLTTGDLWITITTQYLENDLTQPIVDGFRKAVEKMARWSWVKHLEYYSFEIGRDTGRFHAHVWLTLAKPKIKAEISGAILAPKGVFSHYLNVYSKDKQNFVKVVNYRQNPEQQKKNHYVYLTKPEKVLQNSNFRNLFSLDIIYGIPQEISTEPSTTETLSPSGTDSQTSGF